MTQNETDLDILNALLAGKGSHDEELEAARHALQRQQHEQRQAMTRLEQYYECVFFRCLVYSLLSFILVVCFDLQLTRNQNSAERRDEASCPTSHEAGGRL